MANYQYMMSAEDIAKELNCSKSHAYKLIKSMNKELDSQGYVTMPGRIPRAFWATKKPFVKGSNSLQVLRRRLPEQKGFSRENCVRSCRSRQNS